MFLIVLLTFGVIVFFIVNVTVHARLLKYMLNLFLIDRNLFIQKLKKRLVDTSVVEKVSFIGITLALLALSVLNGEFSFFKMLTTPMLGLLLCINIIFGTWGFNQIEHGWKSGSKTSTMRHLLNINDIYDFYTEFLTHRLNANTTQSDYNRLNIEMNKTSVEEISFLIDEISLWGKINGDRKALKELHQGGKILEEVEKKQRGVELSIMKRIDNLIGLQKEKNKQELINETMKSVNDYLHVDSKKNKFKEDAEIDDLQRIIHSNGVSPKTKYEASNTLDEILTKKKPGEYPEEEEAIIAIDVARDINGIGRH